MSAAPVASRLFCFDLASPLCYLAAERISHAIDGPVEWLPIAASRLRGRPCDRGDQGDPPRDPSNPLGPSEPRDPSDHRDPRDPSDHRDADLEARVRASAAALGLLPVRWPSPFPFDSDLAMRVATYARSIGRTVAFAQAAFRQAYAGGHPLDSESYVLIAAAACEMHPTAVLRAARSETIAAKLAEATDFAASKGVRDVPALLADGEAILGAELLELTGA